MRVGGLFCFHDGTNKQLPMSLYFTLWDTRKAVKPFLPEGCAEWTNDDEIPMTSLHIFDTGKVEVKMKVVGFDLATLMVASFFVGIPTGAAAQLQGQAWPDFFGRRSVGEITGITTLMIMPSMAAGPLVAALAFDILGNYTFIFSAFSAGTAISGVCFYLARRPLLPASVSASVSTASADTPLA